MRLLLDTHVLIALAHRRLAALDPNINAAVATSGSVSFASAGSLWEIAVKTRLGKLDPGATLEELPEYYSSIGVRVLPITDRHAVAQADPAPSTRDPFDRLLLAQCQVE